MELHLVIALILALGIGLSLGLLGSGGSLVTLPVLVYVAGVQVASGAGTSLAVIAADSFAGLLGHLKHGGFDGRLTAAFLAAALVGMTGGVRMGRHISTEKLRRSFGWFVLAVPVFMLAKNRSAFTSFLSSESP